MRFNNNLVVKQILNMFPIINAFTFVYYSRNSLNKRKKNVNVYTSYVYKVVIVCNRKNYRDYRTDFDEIFADVLLTSGCRPAISHFAVESSSDRQ